MLIKLANLWSRIMSDLVDVVDYVLNHVESVIDLVMRCGTAAYRYVVQCPEMRFFVIWMTLVALLLLV